MNKYEVMFIINAKVEAEKLQSTFEKFKNLIQSEGTIEKIEEWGKKRLAYEINKCTEGYYYLVNFEAKPSFVSELERNFKISDDVIKYLVIKK